MGDVVPSLGVDERGAPEQGDTTALGDGQTTLAVITALEGYGKDAAPALPLLNRLKVSPDDAIRKAAISAVEKIE